MTDIEAAQRVMKLHAGVLTGRSRSTILRRRENPSIAPADARPHICRSDGVVVLRRAAIGVLSDGGYALSSIPAATGIRSTFKCIPFRSTDRHHRPTQYHRKQVTQILRGDATSKRLDNKGPLPRSVFDSQNGANGPVLLSHPKTGRPSLPRIQSWARLPTERR